MYKIHVLVEPVSVQILGGEGPMSVGQNYTLTCTASGANPPALLSWWDWRGQRVLIPPTDHQLGSDGSARAESSSNSVLVFSPRAEDEGKSLSCRAEHRSLKSRMETSRILSVSCKYISRKIISLIIYNFGIFKHVLSRASTS
jgi:hypothetical protein